MPWEPRFLASLAGRAIAVVVSEGRVAVTKADTHGAARSDADGPASELPTSEANRRMATLATADAGRIIVVDLTATVVPLPPSRVSILSEGELRERLAWRVSLLEFSATALVDVIPMINRHSRGQLFLGDFELRNLPVSGVLRADNLDTLFRFLKSDYGIIAERRSETEIVLRKAR